MSVTPARRFQTFIGMLAQIRRSAHTRGLATYVGLAWTVQALIAWYFHTQKRSFAFIDPGIDSFYAFYPLQTAVTRQLRELHTLSWSFDLGLGGYLGTLFDPFWMLAVPFGDRWQLALRLPLYLVKLTLAGGFFYGYLAMIGFRARYAVIGALCYAFSSYGTIDAQWDVPSGVEFVQFSAFLFLFETYLVRRSAWVAVCAGIALGLGHPIELYSFALFALVYGLVRLVLSQDRATIVPSVLRFAGWSLCGLLLTAPLLLPAIHYFLTSPRVSGDHSLLHELSAKIFTLNDAATWRVEVAGLLGKDLLGAWSGYDEAQMNYFEGPGFYVGMLALVALPQLFGPHASRRERDLAIAALLGIVAYFAFPALRYAVYGFGHTAFRFSTLWISTLLLVLGLAGLRRACESSTWNRGLLIGAGAIVLIALWYMTELPEVANFRRVVLVAGFGVVYAALLWNAAAPASMRDKLPALACVVTVELLLSAVTAFADRPAVHSDGNSIAGTYRDGTAAALALIAEKEPDGQFFRVEKNFDSVYLDDALMQQYAGTKSYTFHAAAETRLVDKLGIKRPTPLANWIGSATCCRDALDLFGVKYVLLRAPSKTAGERTEFVGHAAELDVYRNTSAHGFGHLYDSIASEADADVSPQVDRAGFMLDYLVTEHPDALLTALAQLDKQHPPQSGLAPKVEFYRLGDDRLAGTVQTSKARALLLAMPFDQGWSATLDDRELALQLADYGLTAALIPAGTHRLALVYNAPGRRAGEWLALGSLMLLLLSAARARIVRRSGVSIP